MLFMQLDQAASPCLHTFQAFGNSEKPPRNNGLRGALAVEGPQQSGPATLARGRRIKRRIISCAQLGSRTYERTRTNQELYYQPTGAKTQ